MTQKILSDFNKLPKNLLSALQKADIENPTQIQSETYYPALSGEDVLAQSSTGSGKTLAFLLPILTALQEQKPTGESKTLILAPTRELAMQIQKVALSLCNDNGIKCIAIIGGDSYVTQKRNLKRGADIIVGTPGRIADLIKQRNLKLNSISHFVLDEVDEMLDIGFAKELTAIKAEIPAEAQTLFFSATLNSRIQQIAKKMLSNPIQVTVKPSEATKKNIVHNYVLIRNGRDKISGLLSLLIHHKPESGLIFCETKAECAKITENLNRNGFIAQFLNSDLAQNSRTETMRAFKDKKTDFLVATNVAARGIDVEGLPLVVNLDPPRDSDSYTHRCGRTGRAGRSGAAWTFVAPEQFNGYTYMLRKIGTDAIQLQMPSESEFLQNHITQYINRVNAQKPEKSTYVEDGLNQLTPAKIRDTLKKILLGTLTNIPLKNPSTLEFDPSNMPARKSSGGRGRPPRNGRPSFRRSSDRRSEGGRSERRSEGRFSDRRSSEDRPSGDRKRSFSRDKKPSFRKKRVD